MSNFKQTIKWYDDNAEVYASKIEPSYPNFLINSFTQKVGKNGVILDAGCAGGRDCNLFRQKGLNPVGIDLSKSLVEYAKLKNPNIEFFHGSFLNLPFKDKSFDGVWAHASLLHLEKISEVKKALSEFYRVMKKGAYLHTFVKQQLDDKKTTSASHSFSGDFERFFRFFTKEEFRELLEKAGFEIESIEDNYVTPDGRKEIKWILALSRKK